MRVVSLLPAATEMVAALGAGAWLVGVSHECDWPPEVRALPRVTRTSIDTTQDSGAIDRAMADAARSGVAPIELDLETLRRLAPDVVIGQTTCHVCAVDLGAPHAPEEGTQRAVSLLATLPSRPVTVTLHAHTLDGVFADVARVGEALGLADEADELVAGLRYRLHRLESRNGPRTTDNRLRVLVVEWLDPPYVAGHWVPELVAIAGGQDVGNAPGARSVTRSWRELSALAPDLVVIACCGFDVERAQREYETVIDRDAQALFSRRVEFMDGNAYTSRPGPRLVDAAERLAQLMAG